MKNICACTNSNFVISIFDNDEYYNNEYIRNNWNNSLIYKDNINVLYQSPVWFEHLLMMSNHDFNNKLFILEFRKKFQAETIGIIPIQIKQYKLRYDIKSHVIFSKHLNVVNLLGSYPLLPDSEEYYEHVFGDIFDNFKMCDAIYLDCVRKDTYLWQYIDKHILHSKRNVIFPRKISEYYWIKLPETLEMYYNKFSSKIKYNMKRQVNIFDKIDNGKSKFIRYTVLEDVAKYIKDAAEIAKKSWQQRILGVRLEDNKYFNSLFLDMAQRGIFRSYILYANELPVAFVTGYQYEGVYYYEEIAYDSKYKKYSPGTILLYYIIRDLYFYNKPDILNFGIGFASYKKMFGNFRSEAATILIMRSSLKNILLTKSYDIFRQSIEKIKTLQQYIYSLRVEIYRYFGYE